MELDGIANLSRLWRVGFEIQTLSQHHAEIKPISSKFALFKDKDRTKLLESIVFTESLNG